MSCPATNIQASYIHKASGSLANGLITIGSAKPRWMLALKESLLHLEWENLAKSMLFAIIVCRLWKILLEPLIDPQISSLSEKLKHSYQKFLNPETGYLFDAIKPEDASIRPNQIMAIPDHLLATMWRSLLEVVTRDLLAPYGLRTLFPRDLRY